MSEPEKTLQLIREGFYNTDRPSNLLIKELVEVIKLLDENVSPCPYGVGTTIMECMNNLLEAMNNKSY